MKIYKLMLRQAVVICLGYFFLTAFSAVASDRHRNHVINKDIIPAPGYSKLGYSISDPGSYKLPPLGLAGDGNVLDSSGNVLSLHNLYGDKLTLLSFIYSSCNDINGCPLATYVMNRVKDRVTKEQELKHQVKIITLSFDPKQDTPLVMKRYGNSFISSDFEWHFLTTEGNNELLPILETYNQFIQSEVDENGKKSGNISHILRVFLIDKAKRIRNIYSTSFLHEDILVNDLYSLLKEQEDREVKLNISSASIKTTLHGADENKDGCENKNYRTQTSSLKKRIGKAAKLERYVMNPPLGLPNIPMPESNSITIKKIELGRQLFFDRRLSHNNTISCALCHIPEQGFTSNEMASAVGIEGKSVRRNAPTLYNVVYLKSYFHDGRESTLERQIWGPLLTANEMGNPSIGYVINKIQALPGYKQKFKQAFNGRSVSMETVGMALASYERVLVSGNSQFDQWYFNKDASALSPSAKRGYMIFSNQGNCITCHIIGNQAALFTDNLMHNTGIGYRRSMSIGSALRGIMLASGRYLEIDKSVVEDAVESVPGDLGLYEITENPDDRWKYKTPSLRNVALTSPYMHDGSMSSLKEVIQFYNEGGADNELLDPQIMPLNLNDKDIDDLINFLYALTGSNIDEIIDDAFAVPVGNIKVD